MHNKWIGSGWKMNHNLAEAEAYAQALRRFIEKSKPSPRIFVVPPYTVLHRVSSLLKDTPVVVGAQNMHWEERGAYTGEISPLMVKDSGATLVELGHSERRAYFNETDYTVNLKVLAALTHGLRPLVCVGESLQERECSVAYAQLARQVRIALCKVPPEQVRQVMFAYEPVWAIGEGGVAADPASVSRTIAWLRSQIADVSSEQVAADVVVLYGGSVNQNNALDYLAQPGADGLFIGRAAWRAEALISFVQLIEGEQRRQSPDLGETHHENTDRK